MPDPSSPDRKTCVPDSSQATISGRVAASFIIDIPRPRRIESAEVAGPAALITDRLREEVRRHGI